MGSSRASSPVQIVGWLIVIWVGVYWARSPGGDGAIAEDTVSRDATADSPTADPEILPHERAPAAIGESETQRAAMVPTGESAPRRDRASSPSEVPEDRKSSRTYVVRSGDSLGEIALRIYGSVRHADLIFAANRDLLSSPDDLDLGMVLRLPERPD